MENSGEKRGRGRPKKDGRTNNIGVFFRVTEDDYERLKSVAKELKTTRASALRTLIREAENILNC